MRGLTAWERVQRWPWGLRWILKTGIFAIVLVLVLFPKFWWLPTWFSRLSDMNRVLDPNHPWLAQLETEVRARLKPEATSHDTRRAVEAVVYHHIPYAFDWDTWGVMDWLPTVDEVYHAGREDCDGVAVVAASLLRRMGQDAFLVCDLKHVWVATPQEELMSPGAGAHTMVATPEGTRARLDVSLLANVGRGLAYGIAVFPLVREMILVATLALLAWNPRSGAGRLVVGAGLLGGALACWRWSGASASGWANQPWLLVAGALLALGGLLWLWCGGRRHSAVQETSEAAAPAR